MRTLSTAGAAVVSSTTVTSTLSCEHPRRECPQPEMGTGARGGEDVVSIR
jgi:hypothetical protein